MKKGQQNTTNKQVDEMRPEYDFRGGVRGKHYRAFQDGYTITIHHDDGTVETQLIKPGPRAIVLEPDVQAIFPDSQSVNEALRCLIPLVSKTQQPKPKVVRKPRASKVRAQALER